MMTCEHREMATVSGPWHPYVKSIDATQAELLSVEAACVSCGFLPNTPTFFLEEGPRFELRVRLRVGRTGTWRDLELPRFHRIGRTVGSEDTILRTIKSRRLTEKIENLTEANLEGLIRKYMNLDKNLWPIAVESPAWPTPVILHHGLAKKFAIKGDVDHTLMCSYTLEAIRSPTEAWLGSHNGTLHIRFLKRLSTQSKCYTLLVSADRRTGIVLTSYLIDDQQHEVNREGTLLFQSWGAPG